MITETHRPAGTLVALGMLLFAGAAPAPIVGTFSGLSNLISYSQNIVVARIVTGPDIPRMTTFQASQPQVVHVLYVLKGALRPPTEAKVTLNTNDILGEGDFEVGERYLLFICADSSSLYLANVRGSAFLVPSTTDLSKLRSSDVRTNIGILLNDLVNHTQGPDAVALKKEAADYLHSP